MKHEPLITPPPPRDTYTPYQEMARWRRRAILSIILNVVLLCWLLLPIHR